MADFVSPIGRQDTTIIIVMLLMLFILPVLLMPFYSKHSVKQSSVYLAGENTGDNISYRGSMRQTRKTELRNWYMPSLLHEGKLLFAGNIVSLVIMLGGFFIAMGGAFL